MESYVSRGGRNVVAGEVFHAWTSGDLPRMMRALSLRTNPIDRHHLLSQVVQLTYAKRTDPTFRRVCLDVGFQHLQEMPDLLAPVAADLGVVPRVPTFQPLATVLAEHGRYADAIEVCRRALTLRLRDGTKGGFKGRIRRIEKQREKQREKAAKGATATS